MFESICQNLDFFNALSVVVSLPCNVYGFLVRDQIKSFEMYSDYCNNHPAACEELRELYRNKRYRHFFEVELFCLMFVGRVPVPLLASWMEIFKAVWLRLIQ